MRSGQSFFDKSIFMWNFRRNSEKNSFFEKGNFETNWKKTMKDFLEKQITEIQKISSWRY